MCVCQTDFEIRFLFPIHKNIKLDSIAYNWICYVLWMIHNEMEIKFGLSLQKFERFRPKCWKKLQSLQITIDEITQIKYFEWENLTENLTMKSFL